jgi:hypothetical protein
MRPQGLRKVRAAEQNLGGACQTPHPEMVPVYNPGRLGSLNVTRMEYQSYRITPSGNIGPLGSSEGTGREDFTPCTRQEPPDESRGRLS